MIEDDLKNKLEEIICQYAGGMSTCWENTALLTTGVFQSENSYKLAEEVIEKMNDLIVEDRIKILKFYIDTGEEEAKKLLELITSNSKEIT